MSSLQTIVDRAQQIEFRRDRIVGATMSRSQRVKTSTRNSAQPWAWKVSPPGGLPWDTNRELIESIDYAGKDTEYQLYLNGPAGNYLIGYQGELSAAQVDNITIDTFSGKNLTLTTLPSIGTSLPSGELCNQYTTLFKAGDFIQPKNSRYPYTVVNSVARGTGSTVTFTVHRPVITSEAITLAGQEIYVGTDVSWRMLVLTKPSYSVIPYNRLVYNGDFDLIEKII
jgi:hypothetical protein